MEAAVLRYRELVDVAIEDHAGELPPGQGEGGERVIGVFDAPSAALASAFDIQRALTTETWPTTVPLRAQIAVHTGERTRGGTSSVGIGLVQSRCAAVSGLAHAGQVLMTRAAAELARDALPAEASLHDLGDHRVPARRRAERLFDLRHPDLPGGFAPLRSSIVFGRLPQPLSSFVGRERELAELAGELERSRIVTVTGTAGAGKTRLTLKAAAQAADRHPDGAYLVELAAVPRPELLERAVLGALELTEEPGRRPLETAVAWLHDRSVLLVLDCCEHLVGSVAVLVEELLRSCPPLRVVATSREAPLGVDGERVWELRGLELPREGRAAVGADAVRLFAERGRQARAGFDAEAEIDAVVQICRALDGLPLALELAAGRLRALSASQIAAGLGDSLTLLAGRPDESHGRNSSLRASIDWSYGLLDEHEASLLRRLSVFVGGFELEGAASLAGPAEQKRVLDLLYALVAKSLVKAERLAREPRYLLLDGVRQAAFERLADEGETDSARRAHLEAFRRLAVAANSLRLTEVGRHRLRAEEANLRAALEYAAAHEPEAAVEMAIGLSRWWIQAGQFAAGEAACSSALSAIDAEGQPERAMYLHWAAGLLAGWGADVAARARHAKHAAELAASTEDPGALAAADLLEAAALTGSKPAEARVHAERAVELLRGVADPIALAWGLAQLASSAEAAGDGAAARAAASEALDLAEPVGDDLVAAWAECVLGTVDFAAGDMAGARARMARCVELTGHSQPALHAVALGFRIHADAYLGEGAAGVDEGLAELKRIGTWTALGAAALRCGLAAALAALERFDEAVEVAEPATSSLVPYYAGHARYLLARVALAQGDVATASIHAARLDAVVDAGGEARFARMASYVRGRCALREGDAERARSELDRALPGSAPGGSDPYAIATIEALGATDVRLGDSRGGARLIAAARHQRERLGVTPVPPDAEWLRESLGLAESTLGSAAFATACAEGEAMSLERVLELGGPGLGGGPEGWDQLTEGEQQVAKLAVEGLTNREIGERLFVSASTVKSHLSQVFAKLEVKNRTELAARASRLTTR